MIFFLEPDPLWMKWLGSSHALLIILGILLAAMWIALFQYGGLLFGPSGVFLLFILTVAWGTAAFFNVRT